VTGLSTYASLEAYSELGMHFDLIAGSGGPHISKRRLTPRGSASSVSVASTGLSDRLKRPRGVLSYQTAAAAARQRIDPMMVSGDDGSGSIGGTGE